MIYAKPIHSTFWKWCWTAGQIRWKGGVVGAVGKWALSVSSVAWVIGFRLVIHPWSPTVRNLRHVVAESIDSAPALRFISIGTRNTWKRCPGTKTHENARKCTTMSGWQAPLVARTRRLVKKSIRRESCRHSSQVRRKSKPSVITRTASTDIMRAR